MILTNTNKTLIQPYISWKHPPIQGISAGNSRPLTNNLSNYPSRINFKPNPIKHWRKQLYPNSNSGVTKSNIGITFNKPGSVHLITNKDYICNSNNVVSNFNIAHLDTYLPNSNQCFYCTKQNNIVKSGLTEKLINPITDSNNQTNFRKYNYSHDNYLKSRCKSFSQNQNGSQKTNITYSTVNDACCIKPIPYSNSNNGSQVKSSLNCYYGDGNCYGKPIDIIVKPNNPQFFQQGAVDSSTRLHRLKYNTVTANASSFKTAWGEQAASAGKYRTFGNSPYFIKLKNNVCQKSYHRRNGNKTACV